jgi:nucleotide-binding universal stress UspA family protein
VFNRIIVPTDGSDYSWRAVGVGEAFARQCDAELELLEVVTHDADAERAEQLMRARLADAPPSVPTIVSTRVMQRSVGFTIADYVGSVNGGMTVMSTFGRGRTEAIFGSVAVDIMQELYGPVVAVGPKATTARVDHRGELVVPVDGSEFSESALPLAAAWGIGLEARPWVVEVLPPDQKRFDDVLESSYPARLARALAGKSHHQAQFEVLHHEHPGVAISEFAASIGAALIVASTHGRTGLARLAVGSVAMEIVRHAPCPVVLNRPPVLARSA